MKPYLPYRPYQPYLAGSGPTELRVSSGLVVDANTVQITFSQCVDIVAVTGIQMKIGAAAWEVVAAVASGSEKVWEFTTTTAIAEGDTVLWQYLGAEDSIVDCVEALDVGALGPKVVTNGLELTAPTLVSIEVGTVADNIFVFTYDEEVASTDFTLGWTIEAAETALTLESATVVSPGVIHITATESVFEGQEVLASYDAGVGDIVDVSGYPDGNALASITDEAVTNNSAPPALVSIAITPDAPTITVEDTQQFTATGTYADASTANITATVTWDSSNDSFATIAANGLATGVAEGSVTITATLGAISDTTTLAVEESAVTLVSIAITPNATTIVEGATQQFTATGTYSDASTADITATVTWDSSNDALATITAGGLATGVGYGQATISATLGAISDTTTLDVWTPAAMFAASELGAWFDPSDFSTMFQDVAGTIPVTATGQTVALILDKSGNTRHATQSSSGSRPALQQDGNGKYYLDFDGSDDFLVTPAINLTATAQLSLSAGVTRTSDAAVGEFTGQSALNSGYFGVPLPNTTGDNVDSIGAQARGTATIALSVKTIQINTPKVAVVSWDVSQTYPTREFAIRLNGAAGTDFTAPTADTGISAFKNEAIYIGRRSGTSLPCACRVYSYILRSVATSGATLTNVEAWINGKTGAY